MKKISIFICLLGVLLLFFLMSASAIASESYDFMSDVINSLQASYIAQGRIKSIEDKNLTTLMNDIMVFNAEIEKAQHYVKPHVKSKNELIQKSANNYYLTYTLVIENNRGLVSLIEKRLNNPDELSSKKGTFARELSQFMATNEENLYSLFHSTTFTTYVLINQNRLEDGKAVYLTIDSNERKKLIAHLEGTWGDKVKQGLKAGQLPIGGCSSILWNFLNDRWKSSDSK